jgi:PTH1 family peptidyl-tRNA hydrolase
MKLIVGLGNPGEEYTRTRHNIGRRLIESIAAKEGQSFANKKMFKAFVAELPWDCEPVRIAYLTSYMNLSGGPLKALAEYCKVTSLKDVLVVVDDIALPFGRMRLRADGSTGGHNGLASIEGALASRDYARLRIGIGLKDEENPRQSAGPGKPLHDYVLSAFTREEEERIPELLERGMEACRQWAVEPFEKAMHWVNSTVL